MAGSLSGWFKMPTMADQLRKSQVRADLVDAASRTAFTRPAGGQIQSAESLLSLDEAVLALAEGRFEKRPGIILVTTQRILFVPASARGAGPHTEQLAHIFDVSSRTHRGMSTLTIATHGPGGVAGPELVIDQILGHQADTLADQIRQAQTQPITPVTPERDPIDELIEPRAMHRAGTVTDSEFDARKRQLFDRI